MDTKILGVVFIMMGIIMTVCTGFNYVTDEQLAEMGSTSISNEQDNPVQWEPVIGLMIIVGGFIVIEESNRKKRSA
ncbi:hypothetical protein SAMN05443549_104318 [Flavobacterium fluvii]|uniref:Uncharacterized protein n=1 Tax=Flavobacterium fluvii TaxID=468056 RepID=A0A1M5KJ70_9FLAO|nr:hypothetical protein [Flavobacterium fluvii]SHG52223.1 hypothetical protein SAMN05443549_104318 [Flavobacterium fluvii]